MLTRKAEDYLEAILNISEQKGYARIRDIARALSVTPASAVEMAKKLDDKRLVIYRKYDGVTLTPKGKEIAEIVRDRHEIIRAFLEIINVPKETADKDACIIEHELEAKTIEQIKNLVRFVQSAPDYPQWLKHFEIFCATGVHSCKPGERQREKKGKGHRFSH